MILNTHFVSSQDYLKPISPDILVTLVKETAIPCVIQDAEFPIIFGALAQTDEGDFMYQKIKIPSLDSYRKFRDSVRQSRCCSFGPYDALKEEKLRDFHNHDFLPNHVVGYVKIE